MSLDIINARPLRKQVERFHALVILRLMLFCFVRHVSELFLQWHLFFWHHNANDSLLSSLLAFTQFNYLMPCSAFVLLLPLSFSIYRKASKFILLAEKCSNTLKNAGVLSCADSSCTIHVSTDLALNTWGPWRPIRGHIPCILAGRTKAFFLLYSKKVRLTTPPRIV